MITRDKVAIMNERTKNVAIAKETLSIIKDGCYTSLSGNKVDISESLAHTIKKTKLYRDPIPVKEYNRTLPRVEVVNETAIAAAIRLTTAGEMNMVALNFASARNQGGGFLSGAMAQEEDLCRCSGLYASLRIKPMFYNENILCNNTYYTNNIIYSPDVPFFRDTHNMLLEKPISLSIISAPAPNVGSMENVDEKLLSEKLYSRATKIFQIAEENDHKTIILGAWGCGAFGNDPRMVSAVFKEVLSKIPFEHVVFAAYDTRPETPVFEAFKNTFI